MKAVRVKRFQIVAQLSISARNNLAVKQLNRFLSYGCLFGTAEHNDPKPARYLKQHVPQI